MQNFFRLIIGIIMFLVLIPVSLAGFCNPADRTESIYEDIYCDIARGGNGKMDDEIFEIVAEQLGYDITTTNRGKLAKFIYDKGINISCSSINKFITDENIEYDKLPLDILSVCRSGVGWNNILNNLQTAYDKEKVLYHTKKTLEYEFKAAENFYDGELRDFGDAPFDLVVDLNLIEIVLFGSQAKWDTNADIWKWPSDEKDKDKKTDDASTQYPVPTDEESKKPDIQPESEGITVKTTEDEGFIPECVPKDSPDADHGDHPGAGGYVNPYCGDGALDVLMGEQCDDGNNISGDGCNQYCMLEYSGADLICKDPEAVTFNTPGKQSVKPQETLPAEKSEDPQLICPAGSLPNKQITITGPPPIEPEYPEADQSANYPGPNVGGTFKDFPVTSAPPCPPGQSELKFEYLGKEESTCIKTELCADPNKVRDFLATSFFALPTNWTLLSYSDPIRQALEAIEVVICINITKHDRPESLYQVNEGCIDCHISAMGDSLAKAAETNVTPLCNTTSAFSISSRWGPTFSFSLVTSVKNKVKTWASKTTEETIEKTDEDIQKIEDRSKAGQVPSAISYGITSEELRQMEAQQQRSEEIRLKELENYKNTGNTVSDQEFYSRISILMEQMNSSFENIQGQLNSMANIQTQELSNKPVCE